MLVQCLNLHFSQAAGAEQQPCSELCVLAGPPEKTRKGKMLLKTECLEDFRDRVIWSEDTFQRKVFHLPNWISSTVLGREHSLLYHCVSCGMTLTQERNISCSS